LPRRPPVPELPNNSLQRTRLAGGKLECALPAKLRENESTVARAAGQLSSRPLGGLKALTIVSERLIDPELVDHQ